MPDDQKAIVQRMIDAGESEDNIATVIQHFKNGGTGRPYVPTPIPGRNGVPTEAPEPGSHPVMQGLTDMLTPLAHPQTAGDIAGLLIPSGAGAAVADALKPVGAAISKYGGAAAKVAGTAATSLMPSAMVTPMRGALKVLGELKPSEWNSPFTVAGREGRAVAAGRAFNDLPLAEQMKQLPSSGVSPITTRTQTPPYQAAPAPTMAPEPVPAVAESPIPAEARIAGDKFTIGNQSRQLMAVKGLRPITSHASAEATLGTQLAPYGEGSIMPSGMRPTELRLGATPTLTKGSKIAESTSGANALDELQQAIHGSEPATVGNGLRPINTADAPMPAHPLTQPRIDVGAAAAGRQAGLSKQTVRNLTGPVLGEDPGAASPILPRGPSAKIIDTLKAMGPRGTSPVSEAERDAYVMRANSEKTRAQVKAYLDALRSVGFSGAAGLAARQALTGQMPSDASPGR